MSGLPPPPPGLDLSETDQPRILGVTISTYILAIIAVGLRFLSRRLTRVDLWWDDWLILLSIVWAGILTLIGAAYMVPHGLGKHVWVTPEDSVLAWAIGLFVSEISYTLIIVTVKFSVLCFYWRIFKHSNIRLPIYILGGIVASWGIAVILISIFQCTPVSFQWRRFSPTNPEMGVCTVNANDFFNGNSIPNIITDAALIILPVPYILKLKLPRAQKIALLNVFLLCAFVVGVSIARFTFVIHLNLASPDITWNFRDSEVWTAVESHIGIVCACMPSLRPILSIIMTGSVERRSANTGDSGSNNRASSAKWGRRKSNIVVTNTYLDNRSHPFESITEQGSVELQQTPSSSTKELTSYDEAKMSESGMITVTTDIEVEHRQA